MVAQDADLHPVFLDDAGEEPGLAGPPPLCARVGGGGQPELAQEGSGVGGVGGELLDDGFALGASAVQHLKNGFLFREETAEAFGLFE